MADAKVIHFEIVGKDQKALQAYYRDVFGWKFDTSAPGGYGMTDPATTGVVVGVGATPDGSAGHVTGYVTVSQHRRHRGQGRCGRRPGDHAQVLSGSAARRWPWWPIPRATSSA